MGDCCSHFVGYFWTSTNVSSISPFFHQQQQQQQHQQSGGGEEEEERVRLLSDSNKNNHNHNSHIVSSGSNSSLYSSSKQGGEAVSSSSSKSAERSTELSSLPTESSSAPSKPHHQHNQKLEEEEEVAEGSESHQRSMAEKSHPHEAASAPPELHHKGKEDPHFYQDEASEEGPRWNKARPDATGKQQKQLMMKTGLPKHMQNEKEMPKYKSNSTSSLYIKDTLSMPDIDELLRCISIAILYHIEAGHASANCYFVEIFSEEKHPLTVRASHYYYFFIRSL